jgi:hypothetical protein
MTNNQMAGNYRPDLMPGGTQGRPDVDTAQHPPRSTGLSPIYSRVQAIKANPHDAAAVTAFINGDAAWMLRVCRAAVRWADANQAEVYRSALDEIRAAVNSR